MTNWFGIKKNIEGQNDESGVVVLVWKNVGEGNSNPKSNGIHKVRSPSP